ncbi:MAG: SdrD B-like domain-containing protein, partial [Chloroflexales bacterium]
DSNGNGVQDAGELGVANITVELWRDGGTAALSTTTTLATGTYSFTNLVPGRYYVVFAPTAPYTLTYANIISTEVVSATDLNDSDANQITGATAVTVLVSGENDPTWDAGLYRLAALGDYVWEDINGNGVQEAGEPDFTPTVTVTLLGAGRDRTFGNTDDTSVVTTTNATGNYTFTDRIPGLYKVEFTRPAGYAFTKGNSATATTATDSDVPEGVPATATTVATNLMSGQNDPTWDAGLYRLLKLGNLVWNDLNNSGTVDGAEVGIGGVDVSLYHDTDSNNSYDVLTDTLALTTTTDATGHYTFTGLLQGDYLVVVPASNFSGSKPLVGFRTSDIITPTNYEPAPDPDTNFDNDDNGTALAGGGGLVASTAVSLKPNDEPTDDGDADSYTNLSVDFGFYAISLGNRVWNDLNNDGLLNGGETGIDGVTVNLYYDSDHNGILGTTEITPVLTRITSNGGAYLFTGLRDNSNYLVEVVPPAGYVSSTGANGAVTGPYEPGKTDNTDSDDNGTTSGAVISSTLLTVRASGEITGETELTMPTTGVTVNPAADASSNLTVDFGLFQPLNLGNLVWEDTNNDGTHQITETGLISVALDLYTDTNGNGSYEAGTDTLVVTTTT